MAVALLAANEEIALAPPSHLFLGALGLDGTLRHTAGILPMVALARERGIPVQTLAELVAHLRGEIPIAPAPFVFLPPKV